MSIFTEVKHRNHTYEPVNPKIIHLLNKSIQSKLSIKNNNELCLYENCKSLKENVYKLNRLAESFNCAQIKANGFYSANKMVFKFFQLINEKLSKLDNKKQDQREILVSDFNNLSKLFHLLFDLLFEFIESTNENQIQQFTQTLPDKIINNDIFKILTIESKINYLSSKNNLYEAIYSNNNHIHTSKPLLNLSKSLLIKSFILNRDQFKNIELLYEKYSNFWLDKSLKNFFDFYKLCLVANRDYFINLIKIIYDKKHRSKVFCDKVLINPTINFPFSFWGITETLPALFFVKMLTFHLNISSRTVKIPRQKRFLFNNSEEIDDHNILIEKSLITKNNCVRCRLIVPVKNYDLSSCNKLVLHFHGGGFVSQSPDSHEIYLRKWCHTSEIPFLSVDYTLKNNFPNALQDCLDVYLWLRTSSENEVRNKLGFYPKKIVCCGDSAGGNLALAVLFTINDINLKKKSTQEFIPLPDGIVSIYGAVYLCSHLTSSRIIGSIDTLIPTSVILHLGAMYNGFTKGVKPNSWMDSFKSYFFPKTDPKPWFVEEDQLGKNFEKFVNLGSSYYKSPLLYDKINSIQNVPLCLISAEFCPFLDESVTIAKLWKGPVNIDVIEELNHGFLNLFPFSQKALNGLNLCGIRIKQIFYS